MAEARGNVRQRVLFLSFLLGVMFGVALYLAFKAVQSERYVLLVTLLPMVLISIPLMRQLIRLRRGERSSDLPTERPSDRSRSGANRV